MTDISPTSADVASLGLPTRVVNSLEGAGLPTIQHLLDTSKEDLLAIPSLGEGGVDYIRIAMMSWLALMDSRNQATRQEGEEIVSVPTPEWISEGYEKFSKF